MLNSHSSWTFSPFEHKSKQGNYNYEIKEIYRKQFAYSQHILWKFTELKKLGRLLGICSKYLQDFKRDRNAL